MNDGLSVKVIDEAGWPIAGAKVKSQHAAVGACSSRWAPAPACRT
jgi:hypothetical protein